MTPGNLKPKTIKLLKSLKTMKTNVFFEHGKDAHRYFEKGALNESSRSLIYSFLKQIVFLRIIEKEPKVQKMDQFLSTSQMVLKNYRNLSKFWKMLGPSRVLDHQATEGDWIAPTHFASRRRALRGFFFGKKGVPQKNNAYLLNKICIFVYCCYFGQC